MADIKDFGEKIGGARKDAWALRGLLQSDLDEMNDMERNSHVKKDNIWIKPNWEQVIAAGTPQCVAYWQNKMRQAIPPKPPAGSEEVQRNYVDVVSRIRDAVMAVKDPREINTFYTSYIRPRFIQKNDYGVYVTIVPEANGIVNNKVLKAAQAKAWKMEDEAKKKLFGIPKDEKTYTAVKEMLSIHLYDEERALIAPDPHSPDRMRLTVKSGWGQSYYYFSSNDKFADESNWQKGTYFVLNEGSRKPLVTNLASIDEAQKCVERYAQDAQTLANNRDAAQEKDGGKKRKGAFVPPQLKHIHREGPKYLGVRSADENLFLDELKFRGGEFGHWLNNNDRQANLNMAYEAFRDLARVLHIRPEDISFNNKLAIAFGARGRGGANAAAAHYEPDRQVINLTKMSGAGCLAHEWGHGLDHAIGISCGGTDLASETKAKRDLPEPFKDLMTALKYKTIIVQPEEQSEEQKARVENCRKNLSNWIASVRPKNLSETMVERWDEVSKNILNGSSSITGVEYMQYGGRRSQVITNPEIEMLSQIRKLQTNHGIPKDTKQQIVMWASSLKDAEKQLQAQEPVQKRVKTDFYKGSAEFDRVFARAAHGYWQSDCEMFARAFDCYISDKLKEAGHKSEYLSGHANAFCMPGTNGGTIYAVPMGEERAVINKHFDLLMDNLKERGFFQEFVEDLEKQNPSNKSLSERLTKEALSQEPSRPTQYKQMSFDDLFADEGILTGDSSPKQKDTSSFER